MVDQRRIRICPEAWHYALVLALLLSIGIMREANLLLLVAGLLAEDGAVELIGFVKQSP